jgi:hypothetical protein
MRIVLKARERKFDTRKYQVEKEYFTPLLCT